jgi:predicted CXXCH cytochrome family protein
MKSILTIVCLLILVGGGASAARAQLTGTQSIVNSPHNLSAGGPGAIKAAGESQVCIFCHTPHNATPVQPLWNRSMPVTSYKTYTSNSLKALPGQPTGSSKLCLSCHDGTIALGSVNSRSQPIQMAGGITTLPPGKSNLGTDLSDDHPISFVYDATLVSKNAKLRDPSTLPPEMHLDGDKNLQCTTCHDAHNNRYGNFLVKSNLNSELCNTCHAMSAGGQPTDILQHTGCNNCHATHTAPSGPYLLKKAKVSETCLTCHDGTPSPDHGPNIASLVAAPYRHDTASPVNLPNHIPNNTDCKDCHEPHTMRQATAPVAAPGLQTTAGTIDGVAISGGPTARAQYEYEVCFKCHADNAAQITPRVSRVLVQTNTRLEFAPSAVSFHPVAAKGKNMNVPSLRPPYTTDSMIFCTDCHGSDASKKAGGTGPNGPHGSTYPGLLLARYDTQDFNPYTTTAYALCFRCHDNTKVVADSGLFPFHKKHVDDSQTPCSACHDSHGTSSAQGTTMHNSALINFDASIVLPDDVTHRIDFTRTGPGSGTCTLKCHGKQHTATPYGQ